MRKYVKPRAKFHELKGERLLSGSEPLKKGASTQGYVEDYSLDDNSFK